MSASRELRSYTKWVRDYLVRVFFTKNALSERTINLFSAASGSKENFSIIAHSTLKYGNIILVIANVVIVEIFCASSAVIIKVPMKRNFVQIFCPSICPITENHSVTSFLVSRFSINLFVLVIFNFIRYANYTTYYITVHNNVSKIISDLQRDRHISPQKFRQHAINCSLHTHSTDLVVSYSHMMQH